jgi:hypothetical protein
MGMGHFGLLVILRTLTLQDVAVETALLQVVGDVATSLRLGADDLMAMPRERSYDPRRTGNGL